MFLCKVCRSVYERRGWDTVPDGNSNRHCCEKCQKNTVSVSCLVYSRPYESVLRKKARQERRPRFVSSTVPTPKMTLAEQLRYWKHLNRQVEWQSVGRPRADSSL